MAEKRKAPRGLGMPEIVFGVGLVAMAGLFLVGGVLPAQQARSAAAQRGHRLAETQRLANESGERLETLRATYSDVEGRMGGLPEMGSRREANSRLARLNALASEHELLADELSPGAPVVNGALTQMPVRFAGTGSYPGFAAFLRGLHRDMPDVVVTKFDVSQGASNRGEFQVELALYSLSEDTVLD